MTTATKRACGQRVAGGVYAECHTGPNGKPIEAFLIDPPLVIPHPEHIGLSAIGVAPVTDPTTGVTHVYDIVGREHYGNVADFAEEAASLGASRRIPKTFPFELLTHESRLILLHERAWIENWPDYTHPDNTYAADCPRDVMGLDARDTHGPQPPADMCARLWWEDVEGGTPVGGEHRLVVRALPSVTYRAHRRPDGVTPAYRLAIFAMLPIHDLAVIRDLEGGSHTGALSRAKLGRVEVRLEDE